jgi:two-component system, response regulator RegA
MSEPNEAKPSVLVVDDDEIFRGRLIEAFEERGYEPKGAGDFHSAVRIAQLESPEYAVVDLRMPGKTGLDLVRELKRIDPATNIVVLTGYGSIATAVEAIRLGATHYLTKPADVDEILSAFARAHLPPDRRPEALPEVPTLAQVEWEHIQRVLHDCGGNLSHAARLLGMHRRSLQRKLNRRPAGR